MITNLVKSILVLMSVGITALAAAGSLEGTLVFEKRNPYVGLAYFSDSKDGGPEICGTLDQKDKSFSEMLVVGKTGCDISFTNSDDLDHNIFANDLESGTSFDVGLITPGGTAKSTVNWFEGHMVRIGCKIHPKMVSYIANLSTQYFAPIEFKADQLETKFTISDVPDNVSKVTVILEPLSNIVVQIAPGETKEVDVIHREKVFGKLTLVR